MHSGKNIQRSKPKRSKFTGVYFNFVGFGFASKAVDIADARYSTQAAVYYPILYGLQFPYVSECAFQRVPENFAGGSSRWLNGWLDIVWQGCVLQQVHYLLPCLRVFDPVIENQFYIRQAKNAGRTQAYFVLHRVHGYLNRYGHIFLYLLSATTGPLSDNTYFCIGYIRKCLNGHFFKRDNAGNNKCHCGGKYKIFVFQRKADDTF